MRRTSKALFLAAGAAIAVPSISQAAISITSGSPISENFDGLTTGTQTLSATIGQVFALTGTTFDGAKIGGTATGAMLLRGGDGSSNSGGLWSYASAAAPTDRALGSLASGSNIPGFGTELINNTGGLITSITLTFRAEQWRQGATSTTGVDTGPLAFSYGTVSTASTYLTDPGFTADPAGDINPLQPQNGASGNLLDGNAVGNNAPKVVTLPVTLANGQSVFVRWQDSDGPGGDNGLAIDDLVVTATLVPEPASLGLLGLAGGALLARRRKH